MRPVDIIFYVVSPVVGILVAIADTRVTVSTKWGRMLHYVLVAALIVCLIGSSETHLTPHRWLNSVLLVLLPGLIALLVFPAPKTRPTAAPRGSATDTTAPDHTHDAAGRR